MEFINGEKKMDKYLKLMIVKGLIMSMDEQLNMYFDKDNLSQNLKEKITNKYYDAINEQLELNSDEKMNKLSNITCENPDWAFNIIINGRKHVIHTTEDLTIDWNKVVLLSDLAKTGAEILTITYSKGDPEKPEGTLEVNELVKVKERMIFNVKKEN